MGQWRRWTLKFVGRRRTALHEYQWQRVGAGNWMTESERGVSIFPPMHFHSAVLSLIMWPCSSSLSDLIILFQRSCPASDLMTSQGNLLDEEFHFPKQSFWLLLPALLLCDHVHQQQIDDLFLLSKNYCNWIWHRAATSNIPVSNGFYRPDEDFCLTETRSHMLRKPSHAVLYLDKDLRKPSSTRPPLIGRQCLFVISSRIKVAISVN